MDNSSLGLVLKLGQENDWKPEDMDYLQKGEYADEALSEIIDFTNSGKLPSRRDVHYIIQHIED